jgi:hypothetical protein
MALSRQLAWSAFVSYRGAASAITCACLRCGWHAIEQGRCLAGRQFRPPGEVDLALFMYPELHAASGQVRAFAAMITNLTGQHLPQWIADARDAGLPGIASF